MICEQFIAPIIILYYYIILLIMITIEKNEFKSQFTSNL